MTVETRMKVPKYLVLTAFLSGGINIVISLVYAVLSIVAIVYHDKCVPYDPENMDGDQYFLNTLYRVYIQSGDCIHRLEVTGLTPPDTVFLLMILTLVFSLLVLLCSTVLIGVAATIEEDTKSYLYIVSYIYAGVCVASLIMDITFAAHLGNDYSYLSKEMSISLPGIPLNYQTDLIRLAAMFLLSIALKGFMGTAINLLLLILLVVFAILFHDKIQKEEHSIHKLGALRAYNDQRRRQDSWQESDMYLQFPTGAQQNQGYTNDNEYVAIQPAHPSSMREQAMSDYNNSRFYERPEPWQQHRAAPLPVPGPMPPPQSGSRPFSYLDEAKRHSAYHPPHVPAPDYSPVSIRRIKSALKPAYIRFYERPEPWQQHRAAPLPVPGPMPPPQSGSRPFSYLDEAKRHSAYHPPHVPAPDYSPVSIRRIKSALKPAYM